MSEWGDSEDGELAGDFVGTVSARLLAVGLPRDQRLGALRLLSALDTLADRDDRVRRPLRQVGTEFELPADEIEGWLDALVWVGAVAEDDGGILLLGREQPAGSIRLHDFLTVVSELDDYPVGRRTAPVVFRPAAAVLVAAALIAAVILAPGVVRTRTSNEPTNLAAPAGRSSTTGRAANSTASTTGTSPTTGFLNLPPAFAVRTTVCPTGVPAIEVLDVVSGPITTVSGVISNASTSPLAVTAFTVIANVGGQDLPGIAGTADPITVDPGSSTTWSAVLPTTPPAGTAVRVTLDHWEWRGDAAGCLAA